MSRREADKELRALYDQVPAISSCKGHCWLSCSPIDMSNRERERIAEAGFTITPATQARASAETYWCEALGPDGRCQVYGRRPMICRLWGVTYLLRCPHGCVPDGGWMPEEQFYRLVYESYVAGGGGESFAEAAAVFRRLGDPEFLTAMRRQARTGRSGDVIRFLEYGEVLPPEVTRRPSQRRGGGSPRRRGSGRTARNRPTGD